MPGAVLRGRRQRATDVAAMAFRVDEAVPAFTSRRQLADQHGTGSVDLCQHRRCRGRDQAREDRILRHFDPQRGALPALTYECRVQSRTLY